VTERARSGKSKGRTREGAADRATEPTFGAAVEEIEGILSRLEGDEIDVDDLAREVQRAVTLIALCRAKLARTETEVREFVAALETGPETPAAAGRRAVDAVAEAGQAPAAAAGDPAAEAPDERLPF
jgi:exodeoxyribonuclease VII small subunit